MKWSLHVARPAGISVRVHWSFFLLPLWAGLEQYAFRQSWSDVWFGIGFILLLFGIVVLHELAHALMARRFGIGTRDITLLPIGGVARLERMPEEPKQELLVALAGPAVNAGLALLFFALGGLGSQMSRLTNWDWVGSDFIASLMWVNVGLLIFNLLPAFPMDGGRVLRALLALRMRYLTATRVAANVGQGVALVFGGVGLFSLFFGHLGPISNPFLLLIGIFVWIGARREAGMVELKSSLGGVPVAHLMITDFRTLSPQDRLREAVAALLASSQRDFPVMDANVPVGLLSHSRLIAAVKLHGEDALVGDVMEREFFCVEENESADRAMEELNSNAREVLLVLKDGSLKGLVTREHLRQFMRLRAALSGLPARSEPALPLERKAA